MNRCIPGPDVQEILAGLGEYPPARFINAGWGPVGSLVGVLAAGAPLPVQLNSAFALHASPAVVQPYITEQDEPYVCIYDAIHIGAYRTTAGATLQTAINQHDSVLLGQCSVRLEGELVSRYGTGLNLGIGVPGGPVADRHTLAGRELTTPEGPCPGLYRPPRMGLWTNAGLQPAQRQINFNPPTAAAAPFAAMPGVGVNLIDGITLIMSMRGLWFRLGALDIKNSPLELTQPMELPAKYVNALKGIRARLADSLPNASY